MSGLILYRTPDGQAEFSLRVLDGSVWLTQAEIAELFQISPQAVTQHIRAIYAETELEPDATCKEDLQVRSEGARQVKRKLLTYRLEIILAVGYRVRSPRGTQFRQWATRHLAEYLVKGFVMDDERLKNPGGWDYFDELLARIREIRASEKRFYQKVRDLFALSVDYKDNEQQAQLFFAEVQNKLLYAVTGKTAAELVVSRADTSQPNMALQSFSGSRVRKSDVIVAKNYLNADEIDTLNRLVVVFLEQAELRVKDRQQLSLDYWRSNVDRLLAFNDRPVLKGPGSMSHAAMKTIVHERYDLFDAQRRAEEARLADAQDLQELDALERQLKSSPSKGRKT
ncbi:MAG: virulence RhuM family protein [Rhodocyclaceae bacterium]